MYRTGAGPRPIYRPIYDAHIFRFTNRFTNDIGNGGGINQNQNFIFIHDVRLLEGWCFALDSLVTTDAGKQKLMKDLEIGEEVLSDETGSFTKFFGWMEMNKNTKVEMLEIQTDDGEKFTCLI